MRSRFARALTLAILLLCSAEVLLAHWLSLASRGHGLSGLEWASAFGAFALLNFVMFPLARRRLHAEGATLLFSRGWILGSVAALLTGMLLATAFGVIEGAAWLTGAEGGERATLVWVGAAVVALGFGSIAWGSSVGVSRVRVDPVSLPVHHATPEIEALRIAHITDLHIGPLLPAERLRRYVDQINSLEVDLVAITGDIFDFDAAYVEQGCHELAKLTARHGVYAVLGNHDVYTGAEIVASGIGELTPIRLLRDEWDHLPVGGAGLVIAGIEDPGEGWTERHSQSPVLEALAKELPAGVPNLLLAHRPSWFSHAASLGFHAVLSGHTHGGQVALPGAHNHNLSRMISNRTRGLYLERESAMYVNRGLGVAGLPLRLNCPREIALIQLAARR